MATESSVTIRPKEHQTGKGYIVINAISAHLAAVYNSIKEPDISVVFDNGRRNPCHKAVLALHSQPLATYLSENADSECIMFPDMPSDLGTKFLCFIYTGEIKVGKDQIGEFLCILEQFSLRPKVQIVPIELNSTSAQVGAPKSKESLLPPAALQLNKSITILPVGKPAQDQQSSDVSSSSAATAPADPDVVEREQPEFILEKVEDTDSKGSDLPKLPIESKSSTNDKSDVDKVPAGSSRQDEQVEGMDSESSNVAASFNNENAEEADETIGSEPEKTEEDVAAAAAPQTPTKDSGTETAWEGKSTARKLRLIPELVKKTPIPCEELEKDVKNGYAWCPTARLRYECPLCRGNLGPNKLAFSTHIKLHSGHSGLSELSCKYCFANFSAQEDLTLHIKEEHSPGGGSTAGTGGASTSWKHYRCPSCDFTSERLYSLHLHFDCAEHPSLWPEDRPMVEVVEHENKNYGQDSLCDSSPNIECRICFEELDNLDYFYSHVKIHEGKSSYECKYCFTGFNKLSKHAEHMRTDHGNGESSQKYSCPYCDFATKNKNHLIKHTKQNQHVANVKIAALSRAQTFRRVDKRPSTDSSVTSLLMVGSSSVGSGANVASGMSAGAGTTGRTCSTCGLTLENERALRSHQKLHVTGFPLECSHCLMGFPLSSGPSGDENAVGGEDKLAEQRESSLPLAHHQRSSHQGGYFECLGCFEEYDSYARYVKHLEDTGHHLPYANSYGKYLAAAEIKTDQSATTPADAVETPPPPAADESAIGSRLRSQASAASTAAGGDQDDTLKRTAATTTTSGPPGYGDGVKLTPADWIELVPSNPELLSPPHSIQSRFFLMSPERSPTSPTELPTSSGGHRAGVSCGHNAASDKQKLTRRSRGTSLGGAPVPKVGSANRKRRDRGDSTSSSISRSSSRPPSRNDSGSRKKGRRTLDGGKQTPLSTSDLASRLEGKSGSSSKQSLFSKFAIDKDACSVCLLSIPKEIDEVHRHIHCAAFGVDHLKKIGQSRQCFYCLKIVLNPGNFVRHLELHWKNQAVPTSSSTAKTSSGNKAAADASEKDKNGSSVSATTPVATRDANQPSASAAGQAETPAAADKPPEHVCQKCNTSYPNIVEFVQHLSTSQHYPNKTRRRRRLQLEAAAVTAAGATPPSDLRKKDKSSRPSPSLLSDTRPTGSPSAATAQLSKSVAAALAEEVIDLPGTLIKFPNKVIVVQVVTGMSIACNCCAAPGNPDCNILDPGEGPWEMVDLSRKEPEEGSHQPRASKGKKKSEAKSAPVATLTYRPSSPLSSLKKIRKEKAAVWRAKSAEERKLSGGATSGASNRKVQSMSEGGDKDQAAGSSQPVPALNAREHEQVAGNIRPLSISVEKMPNSVALLSTETQSKSSDGRQAEERKSEIGGKAADDLSRGEKRKRTSSASEKVESTQERALDSEISAAGTRSSDPVAKADGKITPSNKKTKLAKNLGGSGTTTPTTASGKEPLAVITLDEPDVIVLDSDSDDCDAGGSSSSKAARTASKKSMQQNNAKAVVEAADFSAEHDSDSDMDAALKSQIDFILYGDAGPPLQDTADKADQIPLTSPVLQRTTTDNVSAAAASGDKNPSESQTDANLKASTTETGPTSTSVNTSSVQSLSEMSGKNRTESPSDNANESINIGGKSYPKDFGSKIPPLSKDAVAMLIATAEKNCSMLGNVPPSSTPPAREQLPEPPLPSFVPPAILGSLSSCAFPGLTGPTIPGLLPPALDPTKLFSVPPNTLDPTGMFPLPPVSPTSITSPLLPPSIVPGLFSTMNSLLTQQLLVNQETKNDDIMDSPPNPSKESKEEASTDEHNKGEKVEDPQELDPNVRRTRSNPKGKSLRQVRKEKSRNHSSEASVKKASLPDSSKDSRQSRRTRLMETKRSVEKEDSLTAVTRSRKSLLGEEMPPTKSVTNPVNGEDVSLSDKAKAPASPALNTNDMPSSSKDEHEKTDKLSPKNPIIQLSEAHKDETKSTDSPFKVPFSLASPPQASMSSLTSSLAASSLSSRKVPIYKTSPVPTDPSASSKIDPCFGSSPKPGSGKLMKGATLGNELRAVSPVMSTGRRKLCHRKKFGSVNTSFISSNINTVTKSVFEDSDDPYSRLDEVNDDAGSAGQEKEASSPRDRQQQLLRSNSKEITDSERKMTLDMCLKRSQSEEDLTLGEQPSVSESPDVGSDAILSSPSSSRRNKRKSAPVKLTRAFDGCGQKPTGDMTEATKTNNGSSQHANSLNSTQASQSPSAVSVNIDAVAGAPKQDPKDDENKAAVVSDKMDESTTEKAAPPSVSRESDETVNSADEPVLSRSRSSRAKSTTQIVEPVPEKSELPYVKKSDLADDTVTEETPARKGKTELKPKGRNSFSLKESPPVSLRKSNRGKGILPDEDSTENTATAESDLESLCLAALQQLSNERGSSTKAVTKAMEDVKADSEKDDKSEKKLVKLANRSVELCLERLLMVGRLEVLERNSTRYYKLASNSDQDEDDKSKSAEDISGNLCDDKSAASNVTSDDKKDTKEDAVPSKPDEEKRQSHDDDDEKLSTNIPPTSEVSAAQTPMSENTSAGETAALSSDNNLESSQIPSSSSDNLRDSTASPSSKDKGDDNNTATEAVEDMSTESTSNDPSEGGKRPIVMDEVPTKETTGEEVVATEETVRSEYPTPGTSKSEGASYSSSTSPMCPVCFCLLLKSDKMRQHMLSKHPEHLQADNLDPQLKKDEAESETLQTEDSKQPQASGDEGSTRDNNAVSGDSSTPPSSDDQERASAGTDLKIGEADSVKSQAAVIEDHSSAKESDDAERGTASTEDQKTSPSSGSLKMKLCLPKKRVSDQDESGASTTNTKPDGDASSDGSDSDSSDSSSSSSSSSDSSDDEEDKSPELDCSLQAMALRSGKEAAAILEHRRASLQAEMEAGANAARPRDGSATNTASANSSTTDRPMDAPGPSGTAKRSKRPRDNIPSREKTTTIKRMRLTFGDEVVGERRLPGHPSDSQNLPTSGGRVSVSIQLEPQRYLADRK